MPLALAKAPPLSTLQQDLCRAAGTHIKSVLRGLHGTAWKSHLCGSGTFARETFKGWTVQAGGCGCSTGEGGASCMVARAAISFPDDLPLIDYSAVSVPAELGMGIMAYGQRMAGSQVAGIAEHFAAFPAEVAEFERYVRVGRRHTVPYVPLVQRLTCMHVHACGIIRCATAASTCLAAHPALIASPHHGLICAGRNLRPMCSRPSGQSPGGRCDQRAPRMSA